VEDVKSWLARRWKLVVPLAVIAGALAAWLAFGLFAVQTLFIDDAVDEAAPSFTAPPGDGATPSDSEPATVAAGTFAARSHPAEGRALVLAGADGVQRVLRFEGFATDNGPDLNVYLSAAPADAPADDFTKDFVDLGDLKGNVGDQNYVLPASVDLERHRTVVIWCVRFGVAFGSATLVPA
jgi:hypothetical protein